jgi:hypothetical protein
MDRASLRRTTQYAFLLGEHISHSLSPGIFNGTFAALGLDYEYGLLDVPPTRLQEALARMRRPDCLGGNITMPYKRDVLAAAEECSEAVRRCGAASLLINRDGRFVLENTDVEAIAALLSRRASTIATGPAVILGAGGAAAAMLEGLRRVPPTRVLVLARRPHLADTLRHRNESGVADLTEAGRKRGVFDRQAGSPRRLQLLDRSFDAQRVPETVVRIHEERQFPRPTDPMNLLRQFREREDNEVRRPEHRERGNRTGEHACFVSEVLSNPCRDGVEHGCRMDAAWASQDRAELLPSSLEVHSPAPFGRLNSNHAQGGRFAPRTRAIRPRLFPWPHIRVTRLPTADHTSRRWEVMPCTARRSRPPWRR